jgi:hypothetical protein
MTHKKDFLKLYGLPDNTMLSLEDISTITGIPSDALQAVYNRGIGAWKSNPQSVRIEATGEKMKNAPRQARMGKERWAAARVYSFIMKGKTFETADRDIAEHYGLVDN